MLKIGLSQRNLPHGTVAEKLMKGNSK